MEPELQRTKILLPRLHANSSQCLLVAWLKEEGDLIKAGESLAILETDKAAIELTAENSGVLADIQRSSGEWVEIGATLGYLVPAQNQAVAE